MKIILVDVLCESGHQNSNRYIYSLLSKHHEVYFASKLEYLDALQVENKIPLKNRFDFLPGSIGRRFEYALLLRELKKRLGAYIPDVIIFTCFDTISFITQVKGFIRYPCLVMNHNNLDFGNSRLKKSIFKLLPKSVVHCCFEQYICDYVSKEFGFHANLVPHPVYDTSSPKENFNLREISKGTTWIFAPSGSNKKYLLELFIKKKPVEWFFVGKLEGISRKDTISRLWFKDYTAMLASCSAVFIGHKFYNRVSGIFYEALGMKKQVIIPRCKFSIEMKKKYPSFVHILEDGVGEISLRTPSLDEWNSFMVEVCEANIEKQFDIAINDARRLLLS